VCVCVCVRVCARVRACVTGLHGNGKSGNTEVNWDGKEDKIITEYTERQASGRG